MDFTAIMKLAGPILVQVLESAITSFHAPDKPAPPVHADGAPPGTVASPDEFIRHVQAFLNAVLPKFDPNFVQLKVDGWLGDLTKAAGEKAMAILRNSFGA